MLPYKQVLQPGEHLPLLIEIDLAVPLAPGFGGRKHAATTAHVAKSTLTCTVGTTTWNPGDTGHSTPGTPRFGTGLHACLILHCIWLPCILVEVCMHLHNRQHRCVTQVKLAASQHAFYNNFSITSAQHSKRSASVDSGIACTRRKIAKRGLHMSLKC